MIEWLSFAGAGVIAGLIAGLLGLGGGLVIVPILVVLFTWQGEAPQFIMHMAVATSMMTITVTALSSLIAHHRQQNIHWPAVRLFVFGLSAGAFFGAWFASRLPREFLQLFFAGFALLMAIRVWIQIPEKGYPQLLKRLPAVSFSILTGGVSALIGIGGGSLVVPYLLLAGQSIRKAIGTSAACGFPIAIAAVAGFIFFAPDQLAGQTVWQSGFVHWQAFLGIVVTSTLFAPLGVKLAKKLSEKTLRQVFSIALLGVSGYFFLM